MLIFNSKANLERRGFRPKIFDEDFADLYDQRGQPGWSAWRLAMACGMQFLEDLTDRQAAEAVRGRIDGKYALGLELDDSGFDYSVLREFRTRLMWGEAESRLLDQLLVDLKRQGWLKERSQQRTDSTHVLSAIRRLNPLQSVGECMGVTGQPSKMIICQKRSQNGLSRAG